MIAWYALDKARNGAIIAVMEIVKTADLNTLIALMAVALIAGGIATWLAMKITRVFAKLITKINYRALCLGVITFVMLLVAYFSGWLGLLVLLVSTAIGMIPAIKGVGRNHAMGCLLLPVILYFLI